MTAYQEVIHGNQYLKIVAEAAHELDLETYVIGGYVRDLILNRPSKDVDFVCVGSGISLAKHVASELGKLKQLQVFKNYGTAMIPTREFQLEFVGARKESYQKNSRNPIVEEGTLRDDQLRRDFTINALAISLNKQNLGELVDPFEGRRDLKKKIIRTPLDPEITFSDDPLRMIRAIRFASQLMFDIEPETYGGIVNQTERIRIVSQERVTDELNKIIMSPKPSYGFKLLFNCGLLEVIFPEFVKLHGVEVIEGYSHKDNFYHTLQVLDNVADKSDNLWLRWSALLHDIAKPQTKRFSKESGWTFHGHDDKGARMVPGIFRRLKLPLNDKMKYVQKMVKLHLRPISLVKDIVTDSAIRRLIFEAGPHLDDLMLLCRADITSKNYDKVKRFLKNFDKVERKIAEVEERDKIRNFQPPISGEDIMKAFDVGPSRAIGNIKKDIKEAILEGEIKNDYQQAYGLMLELGKKYNLKRK